MAIDNANVEFSLGDSAPAEEQELSIFMVEVESDPEEEKEEEECRKEMVAAADAAGTQDDLLVNLLQQRERFEEALEATASWPPTGTAEGRWNGRTWRLERQQRKAQSDGLRSAAAQPRSGVAEQEQVQRSLIGEPGAAQVVGESNASVAERRRFAVEAGHRLPGRGSADGAERIDSPPRGVVPGRPRFEPGGAVRAERPERRPTLR